MLFSTVLGAGCLLQAQEIPSLRGVEDPNGKIVWYDCKLLALEGKGWAKTESYYDRLPAKAKATVPAVVWDLSHDTAGMFVRFSTDSASVQVRWTLLKDKLAEPHMPATGVSGVDLYARDKSGKWVFLGNGRPEKLSNSANISVAPGSECILYLPLYNGLKSIEIGIPKEKTLSTLESMRSKDRKPVVFYGTSITQGGCVSRPGLAGTSVINREIDVPVINLGFSGSGRMEPALADLLAELDPCIYVLDCLWNLEPALVDERIESFVKTLRKVRPDTPILLVEDSNYKGISPTEKGRRLRIVYDKLVKDGVKGLHLLANTDMLGADAEGTVDGCHPNDLGMMRQSAVFIKVLSSLLKEAK